MNENSWVFDGYTDGGMSLGLSKLDQFEIESDLLSQVIDSTWCGDELSDDQVQGLLDFLEKELEEYGYDPGDLEMRATIIANRWTLLNVLKSRRGEEAYWYETAEGRSKVRVQMRKEYGSESVAFEFALFFELNVFRLYALPQKKGLLGGLVPYVGSVKSMFQRDNQPGEKDDFANPVNYLTRMADVLQWNPVSSMVFKHGMPEGVLRNSTTLDEYFQKNAGYLIWVQYNVGRLPGAFGEKISYIVKQIMDEGYRFEFDHVNCTVVVVKE